MATSPAPDDEANETILAWCHEQLVNYLGYRFIPLPTLSDGRQNAPLFLLCLAHHLYPDTLPNLTQSLHQKHDTILEEASSIFKKRLDMTSLPLDDGLLCIHHVRTVLEDPSLQSGSSMETRLETLSTRLKEFDEIQNDDDVENAKLDIELGMAELQSHPHASMPIYQSKLVSVKESVSRLLDTSPSPAIPKLSAIRIELDYIQAQMLKSTTTTDHTIKDLENRVERVSGMLSQMKACHGNDIHDNSILAEQLGEVRQRYDRVQSWIKDIRVWFIEAERIRSWIENEITWVESHSAPEPLGLDPMTLTIDQVDGMIKEHDHIQAKVEAFDKQDMTRLRAHVQALTKQDLTPGDTTTIGIMFTTLVTLDRLTHLLDRRSRALHRLMLRTVWETKYAHSESWVAITDRYLTTFITENAWWDEDGNHSSHVEGVIEQLLQFEKQVSDFDQGQFNDLITAYEDLDKASSVELPEPLEARQVKLEKFFEALLEKVRFARLVVEHRLRVTAQQADIVILQQEAQQLLDNVTNVTLDACTDTQFQHFLDTLCGLQQKLKEDYLQVPEPPAQNEKDDQVDIVVAKVASMLEREWSTFCNLQDRLAEAVKVLEQARSCRAKARELRDSAESISSWATEAIISVNTRIDHRAISRDDSGELARAFELLQSYQTPLATHKQKMDQLQTEVDQFQADQLQMIDSWMALLSASMKSAAEQLTALEHIITLKRNELEQLSLMNEWDDQHTRTSKAMQRLAVAVDTLVQKTSLFPNAGDLSRVQDDDQSVMENTLQSLVKEHAKFRDQDVSSTLHCYRALESKGAIERHVKERQEAMNDSVAQLEKKLGYIPELLDRRKNMLALLNKMIKAQSSGQAVLETIHQAHDLNKADLSSVSTTIKDLLQLTTLHQERMNGEDTDSTAPIVHQLSKDLLQQYNTMQEITSVANQSSTLKQALLSCAKEASQAIASLNHDLLPSSNLLLVDDITSQADLLTAQANELADCIAQLQLTDPELEHAVTEIQLDMVNLRATTDACHKRQEQMEYISLWQRLYEETHSQVTHVQTFLDEVMLKALSCNDTAILRDHMADMEQKASTLKQSSKDEMDSVYTKLCDPSTELAQQQEQLKKAWTMLRDHTLPDHQDVLQKRIVQLEWQTKVDGVMQSSQSVQECLHKIVNPTTTEEANEMSDDTLPKLESSTAMLIQDLRELVKTAPEKANLHELQQTMDRLEQDLTSARDAVRGRQALLAARDRRHEKSTQEIQRWIAGCQTTLSTLSNTSDTDLEHDLVNQLEDILTKVNEFESKTISTFKNSSSELSTEVPLSIHQAIELRVQAIDQAWSEMRTSLDTLKVTARDTKERTQLLQSVQHLLSELVDLRTKAETWQFAGLEPDDATPFASMSRPSAVKAIESQAKLAMSTLRQLDRRVADLRLRMTRLGGLASDVANLDRQSDLVHDVMTQSQKTIDKAKTVASFLVLTDDVKVLLDSLGDALNHAALHNVRKIDGHYSNSDLQAKRIELNARRGYYDRQIESKLGEAAASNAITLCPRLRQRVDELDVNWKAIQAQAQQLVVDLKKAVRPMGDRGRSSPLPPLPHGSLLTPPLPATPLFSHSPTSSRSSETNAPSASSSSSRIPSYTHGRLAAPRTMKHSKSATTASKRPPAIQVTRPSSPNEYVADPNNDLDMEIGRIINGTPYRIKVQMVPGEVGRYWFGEANPKLAYCRVLKSKMVMVRVGGGWMELSQFLRDHAMLEGEFIPSAGLSPSTSVSSSLRNQSTSSPSWAVPATSPRSPLPQQGVREGFIQTRRGRSVSPCHSPRVAEPNIGYKDGDKYIAVDRNGNQFQVKMVAEKSSERLTHKRPLRKGRHVS